jgi:hypothetical protein
VKGIDVINKIEGPGGIRSAQPLRRAGKSEKSSSGFSQHLQEDGHASVTGVSGLGAVSSISALIGIQEVDDATQRSAKGKKRGMLLLDQLEELRLALLSGMLSKDQLLRLSALVKSERERVDDPRLSEILEDIDLRARVELAKYGF